MAGKRAEDLLTTMFFVERFTLSWAWTDLTDDEFFWEPFPDSWSTRPREDARSRTPFRVGSWVADFDGQLAGASVAGKGAEPMTTIAWLMWHIGSMPGRATDLDFLGGDRTADTGWTSPYIAEHPIFTSAFEATETLRAGWQALRAALEKASDDQLEQRTRFWGYGEPGPAARGHHVIASILNEVSHHGTQICTLRDLYRSTGGAVLR